MHNARIQKNPDFIYLNKLLDYQKQFDDRKSGHAKRNSAGKREPPSCATDVWLSKTICVRPKAKSLTRTSMS